MPESPESGVERLAGTTIDLVLSPMAEPAPREEAERVRRDLARIFPRQKTRQTLRVSMAWSAVREAWDLDGAHLHVAEVAWSDQTNAVAERLAQAGHRVAVGGRREERRRSLRLFTRVPVHLTCEDGTELEADTTTISRHGATLLLPFPLERDRKVSLTSPACPDSRRFRVAWCGRAADELYSIGLEMLEDRSDFWGRAYEPGAAAG